MNATVTAAYEQLRQEWLDAAPTREAGKKSQAKMLGWINDNETFIVEMATLFMQGLNDNRRDEIREAANWHNDVEYTLMSPKDQVIAARRLIDAGIESCRDGQDVVSITNHFLSAELKLWRAYAAHQSAGDAEEERYILS